MPISVPLSSNALPESFDSLPFLYMIDEALPLDMALSKLDVDSMSFDHISTVLSRCATPPPESLPPSPYHSSASSPCESRCPSPMTLSLFLDNFMFDTPADSLASSLASTPFSSSPASPLSASPASSSRAASPKLGRRKSCGSNNSSESTKANLYKIKKVAKHAELAKPTKRSKAVALATKRDSHNISERNRRQELKGSFTVLQAIVPNLLSASRAHTGTVLKETIAYVLALQEQEKQLLAAKSALLVEQSMLMMSA